MLFWPPIFLTSQHRRLRKLRDGVGPKVKGVKVDEKYLSNNFVWRLLEECDKDPLYKQKIRAIFDVSARNDYNIHYASCATATDLKNILFKILVYGKPSKKKRSAKNMNPAISMAPFQILLNI